MTLRGGPTMTIRGDGDVVVAYTQTTSDRGPGGVISEFGINFFSTTADVAAKLSLGTIFNASGSGSKQAVFWDSTAYTDSYEEASLPDGEVRYAIRRGVGIRFALATSALKAGMSLSIASIAAQVQLDMARSEYELQAIGLPVELLLQVAQGLPLAGALTLESFKTIHTMLTDALPKVLEGQAQLDPAEYIVVPSVVETEHSLDRESVLQYAVQRLALGATLAECLKALKVADRFDERAVIAGYAYSQFGASADPDSVEPPPGSAIKAARAWLNV